MSTVDIRPAAVCAVRSSVPSGARVGPGAQLPDADEGEQRGGRRQRQRGPQRPVLEHRVRELRPGLEDLLEALVGEPVADLRYEVGLAAIAGPDHPAAALDQCRYV